MVKQGYYIPVTGEANTWEISVSFRSPSDVCSKKSSKLPIGNQLVINQHTINKSIPMTSSQAAQVGMQPGSCMHQMGQHWFYDLESGGAKMTWNPGNLLPIVPMYAEGSKGHINAFFFTTPACQYDSGHNWDNVPVVCSLTAAMMCKNFCQSDCDESAWAIARGKSPWKDPTTYRWGTMHVFFNGNPDSVKCKNAGAMDPMGRTCPANTLVAKAKAATKAAARRRRWWVEQKNLF